MTAEPSNLPERERRLEAVLVACLEAIDEGRPVDRQEWQARHPEFAAELGRFLDDQGHVDRFAAPLRALARGDVPALPAGGEARGPDAGPEQLGDFRLLREVGRGGMGIVYEAEQISLGRRVALKVFPFAATLDPRQLQRFHNEARAAAGLHHTNIVPVYSVGCDRGVHYYAMQFIDGQTLAQVINALRRPGTASAEPQPTAPYAPGAPAVPSAETPPAGALSTAVPARGREFFRLAARFGIQAAEALDHAHQQGVVHRDVKPANLLVDGAGRVWVTDFGLAQVQSDARLTATGDLVGTLRYMSPEQALAKRVVVDHRTDVYSLGATLYELLSLEPVFTGTDRQELLRQIAFEEPRLPRRLNRAIPKELEIITLKALEKNPDERYAMAQELADDLRRFLEDKPIWSKRPSLTQRATKWTRRHRSLVTSAVILLLVAVIGLAISVDLLWREQKRTSDALGQANVNLDEANKQRLRAEENLSQALTMVSQQLEWAGHLRSTGRDFGRAAKVCDQTKAVLETAMEHFPENRKYRRQLAWAATDLGYNLWDLGREDEAARAFSQGVAAYEMVVDDLAAADPENIQGKLSDRLLSLCLWYWELGELLQANGQLPEAEKAFRKRLRALITHEGVLRAHYQKEKKALQYDFEVAWAELNLALVLASAGHGQEVEALCGQGLNRLERLPTDILDRQLFTWAPIEVARGWSKQADLRRAAGRTEEATWASQQALAYLERQDSWPVWRDAAWFLANCPDQQCRNPARAIDYVQKAIETYSKVSREERRLMLEHTSYLVLGVAHYRAGDLAAASAALDKVRVELERGKKLGASLDRRFWFLYGGDAAYGFFQAMTCWRLGNEEQAREWFDRAVKWMERNKPRDEELRRFRAEAAALLGIKEEPTGKGD